MTVEDGVDLGEELHHAVSTVWGGGMKTGPVGDLLRAVLRMTALARAPPPPRDGRRGVAEPLQEEEVVVGSGERGQDVSGKLRGDADETKHSTHMR